MTWFLFIFYILLSELGKFKDAARKYATLCWRLTEPAKICCICIGAAIVCLLPASQFSYPSMQPLGATNITTTITLVTALDFYRPEVARHIKALPLLSGEMLHLKCVERGERMRRKLGRRGLAASSRRWERVSSDMNTTMHNNKSNFCFVLEFHENKLHQKCVWVQRKVRPMRSTNTLLRKVKIKKKINIENINKICWIYFIY